MRFIYSITFLILISVSLFAQNKIAEKVEGYVFDSINGEPLPFVNILLKETKYHTTTDVDGHFILDSIPEGKYIASLSYVSFVTLNHSLEIKRNKKELYKFYLQRGYPIIDDPELAPEPNRIDSIVFKQKYGKNDSLVNETKTVYGDGGRYGYVHKTYKYNYKNQLVESDYACAFIMDTSGYFNASKYSYNDKSQLISIETKESNNPYSTKQNLYYNDGGKSIRKEIQYYEYGITKKEKVIFYTYNKEGILLAEEKMSNGKYIYSKKYK